MKKLKVRIIQPFVEPIFYRDFVGDKFILPSDKRELLGKKIEVEDDPKTEIIVIGAWNPYAYDYQEYLADQEQKRIDRRSVGIANITKAQEVRQGAEQFNKKLNVPVKWSSEVKECLSSLTRHSTANGIKRNSVFHIFLHEDYENGKLKRKANSFLCSQPKADGNWSGTLGSNEHKYKVTCKRCLEISKRFV